MSMAAAVWFRPISAGHFTCSPAMWRVEWQAMVREGSPAPQTSPSRMPVLAQGSQYKLLLHSGLCLVTLKLLA